MSLIASYSFEVTPSEELGMGATEYKRVQYVGEVLSVI